MRNQAASAAPAPPGARRPKPGKPPSPRPTRQRASPLPCSQRVRGDNQAREENPNPSGIKGHRVPAKQNEENRTTADRRKLQRAKAAQDHLHRRPAEARQQATKASTRHPPSLQHNGTAALPKPPGRQGRRSQAQRRKPRLLVGNRCDRPRTGPTATGKQMAGPAWGTTPQAKRRRWPQREGEEKA